MCSLHHNVAVTHMPHMVVEIEVPCKAVDNGGCRVPMDYCHCLQCLQGLNAPVRCHMLLWLLMYVISPHTLLLHNTSGAFLLVPIVERSLSHLCDALQTFHMLDTPRRLGGLALCTNYLATHCRFPSVQVDGLLYRFKGDSDEHR